MRILRPSAIAVLAATAYALYVVVTFGSSLALVTPGADFSPDEAFHYPNEGEGYDGQFVYYIARDPLNAAPLIDVPAYRYQRILLPALGWLFAAGYAPLIPFSLLLVNIAALGISTALLGDLLAAQRMSRWYALGYALSLAGLGTVRLTLPEPLAYGLCIGAVWLLLKRDNLLGAAGLFALAALAKETALIFAVGVGLHLLMERKIGRAFLFGGIVLLPFIVWQGVLWAWLGAPGIGSGGEGATGFEIVPFMGVLRILTGGVTVFAALMALLVPFVIFPTLWALWRCWRDHRFCGWVLVTSLLFVNAVIMLFVPFSTYREPNAILRFIAGLQIAVILYTAHTRNRRALRTSTFWALTSLIPIMSDIALAAG